MMDELMATGAVLVGRRTAEHAGYYGGNHHHGVRIIMVSHRPAGPEVANYPLVTYVTDGIERAVAQAKAAASDRNVRCMERIRRNERSKPLCSTRCRSI
jgi:dihydrofolate reductase